MILWTIGVFPRKFTILFFGGLAKLGSYFLKKEMSIAIDNLTNVYQGKKSQQEIKKMARNVFTYLGRNWTDILRYRFIKSVEDFRKIIKVEGWENLKAGHAKGKGVILLANHMGAFDLAGMYLFWEGYDCLVMGAPLHNSRMNKLLVENRKVKGGRFLSRGEDRTNTIKMMKELRDNGQILLLIDQDTKGAKSIFVDFMGKPAATPVGVTIIARKTGASVVPMQITIQEDLTHKLVFGEPFTIEQTDDEQSDLIKGTQKLSDVTEKFILEAPEQWVWFHERWKRKPEEYSEFLF